MSTLRTNALEGVDAKNSITIVAGAGNITTTNVQSGLAKAYVRANDDAQTQENQSVNVASSTDHGTGDYSYTLTNSLDTRGVQVSNNRRDSNPHITCMNESRDGAGTMAVRHYNTSGLTGGRHLCVLFGDLA